MTTPEAFDALRSALKAKITHERDVTQEVADAALIIIEQLVNDIHAIAVDLHKSNAYVPK